MKRWFTVATEGQTTDKREITRDWLKQIAATYDPKKFGARIWMEHYRSVLPDSPFRAYGDVLAVRTVESEGKFSLQAQIDPTSDLVKMAKARQKIYSSIEVDPDFAGSGQAYLTGLGVTDNPASLGTDVLTFSAKNPDAPNAYAARKTRPETAFSSLLETPFDFSEEAPESTAAAGILTRMKELFSGIGAKTDTNGAQMKELGEAFLLFSDEFAKQQKFRQQEIADLRERVEEIAQKAVSSEDFRALVDRLDSEDADPTHRRPSPGATHSGGTVLTDC